MEWIALCDTQPLLPESVEFTDGHTITDGYFATNESGALFAVCDIEDFTPLWWRPYKNSMIQKNFEENTFCPNDPTQWR